VVRVAFLGGGTGGHLTPGVAVAQQLRREGHDSLFLIAGRDVERRFLEPRCLPARELFGESGRPRLVDVGRWAGATLRWRRAVKEFDPHAIVVLGGWVALPAVLTGFFGRPSVLIEQNARPGRVQRLLDARVGHACLSVGGRDMPKGRRATHVTGNPLPELDPVSREEAARHFGLSPERRTLLLMGGSQGAGDLNALLPDLVEVLGASGQPWQVLNITGEQPCPPPLRQDVPVVRRRFVNGMSAAYALADVAVCRAGAGSVAELAATGTPAVLVPYPHHADHHQEANGRLLVDVGAALMVGRDDPTGHRSAPGLLRRALPYLQEMSLRARSAARPRAARDVTEVVLRAAQEGA